MAAPAVSGRAPRTAEAAFNAHFGEALRGKHPLWREHLGVEETGAFADDPRLRPDILVRAPGAQPVAVETEFAPAATVEDDARARLGKTPAGAADAVEQAVAVRIPAALGRGQAGLAERIEAAEFAYCVLSGDPAAPARWPEAGWLSGGIDDVARCIEHAMASQRLVVESMSILEDGVRVAARAIRDDAAAGFPDIVERFGRVLNQRGGEQTTRMAMTIVANALTFHAVVAGVHNVPSIADLETGPRRTFQLDLLECWRRILDEINYWPIFKVASDLVAPMRAAPARRVLRALAGAAERLAHIGVTTRHDLTGRMFQNLITDRKFLATFYTMPASAALLAEMAAGRMNADWRDLAAYPDLRIADLSCGTGTLLSAAYHAVLGRYRRAGGDDKAIHARMLERALIAADIMPAAAHLCASQLSSVHPGVAFENTRVWTMPYGVGAGGERDRGVAIGSLDLTAAAQTRSLFATGQRQAKGGEGDADVNDVELPHGSVDLTIMNPPFTSPTNHEIANVPVPSFAGFRTTEDEQRAMSDRLASIRRALDAPAGHGNAGLASNFVDLAHAKTKPGGVVAFVLPITAIRGRSWAGTRALLERRYEDIAIVSIASARGYDRAFSADTGMAEALVVATKRRTRNGAGAPDDVLFVNLRRRPSGLLEAAEVAALANRVPQESRSGRLQAGEQLLGMYIRAPLAEAGCAALRELSLAETAMALRGGALKLPRDDERRRIPVAPLGELGERGLLDRDISNRRETKPPFRGPFTVAAFDGAPDYPILWNHDAARERRLVVRPDMRGEPRPGCEARAAAAWKTATRLHYTQDFGLAAQSLAACLTPAPALGGRAWPNFRAAAERWEPALALWANCTLGLIAFWWAGSRQQPGRSVMTITSLPGLMSLDARALAPSQIDRAAEIFASFRETAFAPANEAWRDDARTALDRAVLVDLLGLPGAILEPLAHLRRQWCAEPSVHGGKRTAPPEAGAS